MHILDKLASSIAIIAAVAVPLHSQSMTVDHTSLHGCHLSGFLDSEFTSDLDKHAPSWRSSAGNNTELANSVVLTNGSSKTVAAYSLRWTFRDSNGTSQTHDTSFSEPFVLSTHHTAGGMGIPPAGVRLIHPSLNASERDMASAASVLSSQALGTTPNAGQLTSVHLDGVIYDDGTFTGPNDSHFLESFTAKINARHDSGVSVLLHIEHGLTDAQLVERLEDQASKRGEYRAETSHDLYYLQRSLEASELLKVFRTYGRTALVNNAKLRSAEPRHLITRDTTP